jgi:hypothetical protein
MVFLTPVLARGCNDAGDVEAGIEAGLTGDAVLVEHLLHCREEEMDARCERCGSSDGDD